MPRPPLDPIKSTNGRFSLRVSAVRAVFGVLNHVPPLAARWAETLFFTPPRHTPSSRTAAFLASGQRLRLPRGGPRIAAWSWGEGPVVVLVHGWGGLGGQLGAFCPPLVESGVRVVTFDAPGHGASSGRRSSVLDFAATLHNLAAVAGPLRAVIAHSLGATATALALRQGLRLERAVFLGPPAEPSEWAWEFARRFAISDATIEAMRVHAERRLGFRWADLGLAALAKEQTTPLLVIHDAQDDEVDWTDGAAVAAAWPGAQFLKTSGLGHRRILRDRSVVERTVGFVGGCGAKVDPGCLLEPGSLEQYLYVRDAR
jgi:pimeloyl-ACP methyl ester carboxylesterase